MKTRKTRRRRRGINALFCFLLAAGLMLGEFNMPTQAEESEITDLEAPAPSANATPPPSEKTDGEAASDEPENEDLEFDEPKEEDPEPEKICICDSLCDGNTGNINAECPVCAEDFTLCAGNVSPEEPFFEIPEEIPQEEVPVNVFANATPRAIGDTFQDAQGIWYKVVEEGKVEVTRNEAHFSLELYNKTITIPKTVTDDEGNTYTVIGIGEAAFGDTSLNVFPPSSGSVFKTISLPDSLGYIDKYAFCGCSFLTSIVIPDRVTSISEGVFYGCGRLERVTLPDTVTGIGAKAFQDCSTLNDITIPENVDTLGEFAFCKCSSLRSITIPRNIESLETAVFSQTDITELIIPENIKRIGNSALSSTKIQEIIIPDTVTEMGEWVFGNCSSLKKVRLSNQIPEIKAHAFDLCGSLEEIIIPDSVTFIGFDAFCKCEKLPEIVIPGSVKQIDGSAFYGCTELKKLTIENGVEGIGHSAFYGCKALEKVDFPDSVTQISAMAFYQNTSLTSVTLPPHIDTISRGLFYGCENLTEITIPNSVTRLWEYAFCKCSKLENVTILNGSVQIDDKAFENCVSLTKMSMAIKQDNEIVPATAVEGSFKNCPDRTLTFLTEDGKKPLGPSTVPTFDAAKSAFDQAGDGIDQDGLWWGWQMTESAVVAPEQYDVAVTIKKDNTPWGTETGNNKVFAFKKENESDYKGSYTVDADGKFIAKLDAGNYEIYEVVETQARAVEYRDTNVSITAELTEDGSPTAAVVDYYTATFYDGSVSYGDTTDQRSQIVLKNTGVVQPLSPRKSGYSFSGWKTEIDGNIPFDFEHSSLVEPTSIYASWTTDEKKTYFISASAEGGGSISPSGNIEVTEGTSYTFTTKADEGYRIQSVIVDETDLGAQSSYTFSNVDRDHTIKAIFEKIKTDPVIPDGGSSGNGTDSGSSNGSESADISAGSSLPEAGAFVDSSTTIGNNTASGANGSRSGEPKTGDPSRLEVYAFIAMITGFVYLVLSLMDSMKGMSEEEKDRLIASLLRWAKKRHAKTLRRYIALAAIFFVLAYYHAFGKRIALKWQTA